jgi:hypothetical protein
MVDGTVRTRYPDKLLCERARRPHISITEDNSHTQNEGEQDDGIGIKAKIILTSIDSRAVEPPDRFSWSCQILHTRSRRNIQYP